MSEYSEENFRNLIGGSFGQVEAQVGPEAYQAHTDVQKSIAEFNRTQVKMIEAQIESGRELSKIQGMVQLQRVKTQRAIAGFLSWAFLFLLLGVVLPWVIGMWQEVL